MKKNVFITGSASGLGRESALSFANSGHRVFAGVRRSEDGQALALLNPNIMPVVLDLSDPSQIASAAAFVDQACGEAGLSALINMAGYAFYAPIEYTDAAEAKALFDVLLFAPYRLSNALLPSLKRYASVQGQRGKILNIISWASQDASPFVGFYAAAKAALLRLTQAQYLELARFGIDAVAILPGLMKTPFIGNVGKQILGVLARLPEQGRHDYGKNLERMADMSSAAAKGSLPSDPRVMASKILAISRKSRPKDQYKIGLDTHIVDFMNRFLPFAVLNKIRQMTFDLPRSARQGAMPRANI